MTENRSVPLRLTPDEALVLFEFLARMIDDYGGADLSALTHHTPNCGRSTRFIAHWRANSPNRSGTTIARSWMLRASGLPMPMAARGRGTIEELRIGGRHA